MPLTPSDFPEEVQVAFFIYDMLSDRWDGMSGSYQGKDWSQCEHLFKVYNIEDPKVTLYFMKMWERIVVNYRADDLEKRRKAEENKLKNANGGGKQYTHNISG